MKRLLAGFRSDSRGAAIIEFAFVAPVLILFLIGIARFGILFMANAGLRSAVQEGARCATIFPRPTDAQIKQRITSSRFGLDPANLTAATVTYGISNGAHYADIRMTYTVPMNMIFFSLPAVTLVEQRRAFIQPPPPAPAPPPAPQPVPPPACS